MNKEAKNESSWNLKWTWMNWNGSESKSKWGGDKCECINWFELNFICGYSINSSSINSIMKSKFKLKTFSLIYFIDWCWNELMMPQIQQLTKKIQTESKLKFGFELADKAEKINETEFKNWMKIEWNFGLNEWLIVWWIN